MTGPGPQVVHGVKRIASAAVVLVMTAHDEEEPPVYGPVVTQPVSALDPVRDPPFVYV